MGKLGKFLIGVIGFGVLVVVGLTAFVKLYLTDEKVRELVVPQAEKALGRKVALGSIQVGLLSGITIEDFSVKELDGQSEFVSAEQFVIAYQLVPLLHKEVVLSEITLVKPRIVVRRDNKGEFNFQSLKVFADRPETKTPPSNVTKAVALPIAVTVDTIKIVQANLIVNDAKGELPDVNVLADMAVAVTLGSSLDSLRYNGRLEATVEAEYGEISPNVQLSATFDPSLLEYTAKARLKDETMTVAGTVKNYLATPQLTLRIISDQLNLDYLAGLGAALPQAAKQGPKQTARPKAKSDRKTAIAESLPPGFQVDGTVSVANTVYKKLAIKDFFAKFDLKDGFLTVNELKAATAGGSVGSSLKVDLNKPDLAYNGKLTAKSLDMTHVGKGLEQSFADIITGTLASSIQFSGSGMDSESIKKALTAQVEYSLLNGQISNTQLTDAIAALLKVPQLQTIAFSDISGALELLKGGRVKIKSGLKGRDVSASTQGSFDLDGNLNLPVNVTLPGALMEKIDKRGQLGQLLADDDGSLRLTLNVLGNYLHPQVSLDESSVKKQVKKVVQNKVIEEVERSLFKKSATGESKVPPEVEGQLKGLLKGLFGQ